MAQVDEDNVSRAPSDIETILRKLDTTVMHVPDDLSLKGDEEEKISKDLWDKKQQFDSKFF